jgi:hypothetical protein
MRHGSILAGTGTGAGLRVLVMNIALTSIITAPLSGWMLFPIEGALPNRYAFLAAELTTAM